MIQFQLAVAQFVLARATPAAARALVLCPRLADGARAAGREAERSPPLSLPPPPRTRCFSLLSLSLKVLDCLAVRRRRPGGAVIVALFSRLVDLENLDDVLRLMPRAVINEVVAPRSAGSTTLLAAQAEHAVRDLAPAPRRAPVRARAARDRRGRERRRRLGARRFTDGQALREDATRDDRRDDLGAVRADLVARDRAVAERRALPLRREAADVDEPHQVPQVLPHRRGAASQPRHLRDPPQAEELRARAAPHARCGRRRRGGRTPYSTRASTRARRPSSRNCA